MRHNALRVLIGCLTLGLGCLASVVATAGDGDRRSGREELRDQRQGGYNARMPEQGRDSGQRRDPQGDWRGGADHGAQPPQPELAPPQQTDNGRRNSRMSPEDRRALRRQIDQASHDLYEPRR